MNILQQLRHQLASRGSIRLHIDENRFVDEFFAAAMMIDDDDPLRLLQQLRLLHHRRLMRIHDNASVPESISAKRLLRRNEPLRELLIFLDHLHHLLNRRD